MLAFLLLFSLFISSSLSAPSQKSVSLTLDSKWKNTPLHLEASEFLSEENSDLFWKFIEEINKLGPDFIQQLSEKQQYEVAVEIASHLLSPAKLALLKFSLALRAYSPAVELFHQIAHARQLPSDCRAVVEVGNEFVCDSQKLEEILQRASDRSEVYKVDHKYPSVSASPVVAILYGEIGTSDFISFHKVLVDKTNQNQLEYVLRHYSWKRPDTKVRLSGYGVELAIKSTEYKAQDDTQVKDEGSGSQKEDEVEKTDEIEGFLFHKLRELHPDKTEQLDKFKAHVLDSTKELDTLKVWELQELSLQAAQHIVTSAKEEALRVMRDVSQNFPIMAKSLVQISVTPELKREVERNQQMFAQYHNLGPSDAALFLNGLYFDVDVTDMFTLLQMLKQETCILEGLSQIGIKDEMVPKLMKLDLSEDKQDFAVDIRDTSILYLNDIENDKLYRTWPSSLQDMLRVTYPGMLRNVRKNIYHLVIVADPSSSETKDIFKLAESFYVHKAPLRIGIVFAVNNNNSVDGFTDAGVAILNAYNFISQDKSPYDGLSFITDVYATVGDQQITPKHVIKQFEGRYKNEDLSLIFGLDSDYDVGRKLAWDFINRTGIGAPPQVLINGVILKKNQLNVDLFEEAVLSEIMRQTPFIQKSVYKGDLTDSQTVIDFLMSQSNVMPRLNKRILTPGSTYIDLTGRIVEDVSVKDHGSMSVRDSVATFESSLHYLTKNEQNTFHPLTVWAVADFETAEGQDLLLSALLYLKSSGDMRLGIVHNPLHTTLGSNTFALAVQAAAESLPPSMARVFISKLLKSANLAAIKRADKSSVDFLPQDADVDAYTAKLKQLTDDFLHLHSLICQRILKVAPGKRAVVLNGRIIGPFNDDETFGEDDFSLLEKYSMNVYGDKLSKVIKEDDSEGNSGLLMKATTVLMNYQASKTRHDIKSYGEKHSVVKIAASDETEPAHEIVAIVDPVSRGAQKLSSVLLTLKKVVNANIKIFLNCVDKHSSMPLKSFYRFVVSHEPEFNANEQLGPGPIARFNSMPSSPLLTLGMATPENWMVESVKTPYDLDNIHLERVDHAVHAEFELEYLLLEGHCFEQSTGNPPRGLQFTLGTATNPVIVDTIVMANLGYFQLKANPGVWFLKLRHGRSTELYDVVSQEGTDSDSDSSEVVIAISNFRSHVIKIKVNKKPGKQHEELLLDENEKDGGIWNSIANSFSGHREKEDDSNENLNIFSLASGHLYERLLRIMMLSVLKHTKTPVKFWFLKNYLSPTFKDFLPHMAKEYNFEYELVQYKWPRWLNQQTEKQRIIWGYKILFLDVLFPLDVKKFIFVDADQVVRTDLKELRDMDLGGAPYGYTPFCESRDDMDGFRFWKTGYWASHLAGRRYHISALYVVDLKKFRRIAAGDRLRGQYQGLSQDPNSLSNLDQDLPNNMIHQVNIKSLPQEWLWCETWCDDESKKYAKTIDLCNNPKTKEPKLVAAMRILPEWKGYDTEIKDLLEKVEKEKKENSSHPSSSQRTGTPGHIHEDL